MNVVAHGLEIAVAAAVHVQRFIPPAEQVAKLLVPMIEAVGINAEQPLHSFNPCGPGCLCHEMKVIVHQAPRVNLPVGFLTGFCQRVQEEQPVLVVVEYGIPAVATVHDVINRAWILNSELASHIAGQRMRRWATRSSRALWKNFVLTPLRLFE